MSFENILHGHSLFAVLTVLLLFVLGLLIFLAVKMFRKSRENNTSKDPKKYGIIFILGAVGVSVILAVSFMMHYHLSIKA